MKKINVVFAMSIALMMLPSSLFSQNFQGEAIYQSSTKMGNFSIKGEGMSPEMEAQLKEKMQKQMQKEYTLKFNLSESVWKEVESLEGGPAVASGGGVMIQMSSAGGGTLYKNTSEMKYLREADVFSKPFLVDDVLESREWVMGEESRKIGNYNAYKATYTNISERKTMSFDGDQNEMKTVMDTTEITAWYTPEIPVSQGPSDYWGLPGLILEVSDGSTTFLCTKITLNPAGGVEINKPSKGKRVNRDELKIITDEKTQEMMQKFSNGGGKGERIQIKIGGN
jgi:GLPGLI family protein